MAPRTEVRLTSLLPASIVPKTREPSLSMTTGPFAVTDATVTGVRAASLIQTPPPAAAALIVPAFTHKALSAAPPSVAESTVTALAVTFGWPALEPPASPSSTAPVAELSVVLLRPESIEPIRRLPRPPITTGPAPAVTEVTVTGVVAASLIQTPPPGAAAVIDPAFTQSA
jgi:hypothetical protein